MDEAKQPVEGGEGEVPAGLLPCWCGSEANWWFSGMPERCRVICMDEHCSLQTPLLESKDAATKRWNTRALSTSTVAQPVELEPGEVRVEHLFGRLQTSGDILGYLFAAHDRGPSVFETAMKDVIATRAFYAPISDQAQRAAIAIKKYADESGGDEIATRVIERIIKDSLGVK